MKKILLSLVTTTLSCFAFAQSHSDLSENALTASGEGYTFNFKGSSANNCEGGGGVQYYGETNQVWSLDGSDNLIVTIAPTPTYTSDAQQAKFYSGDCVVADIDLSSASNQKIAINLTSPEAGELVVITYSGTESNYAGTPNTFALVAGANTLSATSINLVGITNNTTITGVGLLFRGPLGWSDETFNGSVTIDFIKVGDAVSTTNVAKSVDNTLISVYPNPSKEFINVDLSSLTNVSDATVKIVSSNGTTVYESIATSQTETINTSSLLKGIYMVQVTSGNKIANKKIVIN